MNKLAKFSPIALMLLAATTLTGCQDIMHAVGSIFKAGMGVGIFLVLLIVALVIFVISRLFGGNRNR